MKPWTGRFQDLIGTPEAQGLERRFDVPSARAAEGQTIRFQLLRVLSLGERRGCLCAAVPFPPWRFIKRNGGAARSPQPHCGGIR